MLKVLLMGPTAAVLLIKTFRSVTQNLHNLQSDRDSHRCNGERVRETPRSNPDILEPSSGPAVLLRRTKLVCTLTAVL